MWVQVVEMAGIGQVVVGPVGRLQITLDRVGLGPLGRCDGGIFNLGE